MWNINNFFKFSHLEHQYFTITKIIKYFGCSNNFWKMKKKSSKIKLSSNSSFFILIFAISKFWNTGRSTFRRSIFWPLPGVCSFRRTADASIYPPCRVNWRTNIIIDISNSKISLFEISTLTRSGKRFALRCAFDSPNSRVRTWKKKETEYKNVWEADKSGWRSKLERVQVRYRIKGQRALKHHAAS